jgi:V8-like Glu-specific endopeptidase
VDDFLRLENAVAKEALPAELAATAATDRLIIHDPTRKFDPSKVKPNEATGAWESQLPRGATLGLPGRKAVRLPAQEIVRGADARSLVEPFHPAWMPYAPHAKLSAAPNTVVRARDGRIVRPDSVFGSDGRQVYYPSGYPWTCVGRIFAWNDFSKPNPAWSGSGVLIGGRVVLTAGHVVPWGSGNWAMKFVPAYYDGASALGAGVYSWVSDANGYNDPVSAWDMAVLRLYTPLGDSYGYFGTKAYSSSWEGGNYWTLAGYPGAVAGANRPSRQMWWPVVDDDGDGGADKLEYYADTSPGDSGGPVFGFWSGAPYAIGTHGGDEVESFLWWTTEDDNAAAGGGALNSLVRWARTNWP